MLLGCNNVLESQRELELVNQSGADDALEHTETPQSAANGTATL